METSSWTVGEVLRQTGQQAMGYLRGMGLRLFITIRAHPYNV